MLIFSQNSTFPKRQQFVAVVFVLPLAAVQLRFQCSEYVQYSHKKIAGRTDKQKRSYFAVTPFFSSGPSRARTLDPLIMSQML